MEDEDIIELVKFFYMTYQRISEDKCCLTLKSDKIFPIHQDLIEKKGIGLLHRALFTHQRKFNRRRYKERSKKAKTTFKEIKIIKEVRNYKEKIDKDFLKIGGQVSDFEKKSFIEHNINYSSILKKYVEVEKKKEDYPSNYINIDESVNKIENLAKNMNSNENSHFILSLIGKCFEKNKTKMYVPKENNQKIKCIELISMQSLFCLINQKKYEFHFNFGKELNEQILYIPEKKEKFLKEYKIKIANNLNINPDNFIFTDVHHGCIAVHSSIINPTKEVEKKIKELKGKDFIQKIEEKPILEELHIDSSILDSKGDKNKEWSTNSFRGGEKYIPPIGWYGIGLKVDNLYRNYNNWLSNKNVEGEFAVAYLGINNFLSDKDIFLDDLEPILHNIREIMVDKLYINENDIRNNNNKCRDGICVFQNPEHAENSAGIVDILGYRMKIIIMCRINPKKIRQPASFPECWIINPTPDEIRPYRILIKKIPISPLTIGLTNKILFSNCPIEYIITSIKSEDLSILKLKYEPLFIKYELSTNNGQYYSDDIFVIRLYSSFAFKYINAYLRNKIVLKGLLGISITETQLKSWIYCLQKALSNYKNVKEDTIVYRGVRYFKFPPEIGVGSKFYLREFLSTSMEKPFSESWMRGQSGTFMTIIIKNNGTNGHKNYCSYIESITFTKKQYEVLFCSHCFYTITKINRNDFIDYVDLICEGCFVDEIPSNYFTEISINYKINDIKEINLFGEEFVKNNSDNCSMNINGKEYELCSKFNLDELKNCDKKESTLKIKLKGINKVKDMNSIFKGCSSLISVYDIHKWNTENITNMNSIFANCESLTYLPDISNWDTRNVTDISFMFFKCKSLLSLPDISNWDTRNVKDISGLFQECSSLLTLPDISKWNTSNVTQMFGTFYGCSSLSSLPDISNWNTSNNETVNGLFTHCTSLKNIPDISKWDTSKIYDMNGIFYGCSSLQNIPDISKWNTSKAFYMEYMFFGCSSLESLPDISKWDTTNTFVINNMFDGCKESFDVPKKFMNSFIELKKKLPILLYIKEKNINKVHKIKIGRKETVNNLKKNIEQMLNIKIKNPLILKPKNESRYYDDDDEDDDYYYDGLNRRRKKILDNELLTLEDSGIDGGDTILIE